MYLDVSLKQPPWTTLIWRIFHSLHIAQCHSTIKAAKLVLSQNTHTKTSSATQRIVSYCRSEPVDDDPDRLFFPPLVLELLPGNWWCTCLCFLFFPCFLLFFFSLHFCAKPVFPRYSILFVRKAAMFIWKQQHLKRVLVPAETWGTQFMSEGDVTDLCPSVCECLNSPWPSLPLQNQKL